MAYRPGLNPGFAFWLQAAGTWVPGVAICDNDGTEAIGLEQIPLAHGSLEHGTSSILIA